ncbi:MAG TPA: hypothetical protein DCM86_00710, partial [Verrucomicrobiales bacterium]|nr:hypothetical protein [Verrucomicrobiales bacterium]
WTPTEAQGPGTYSITVRVTDDGTPALSAFETIQVTVNEVNVAPVLAAIGDKGVKAGSLLTFTAVATDADLPVQTLTYTLDPGAPAGAVMTPAGVFSWTPAVDLAAGDYTVVVRVADDAVPPLSASESVRITVNRNNSAPSLAVIPDQCVHAGGRVLLTAVGTDPDQPANHLAYSLDPGAPAGAVIDAGTGVFSWSVPLDAPPGGHAITIRVVDDGLPPLDATRTFQIDVGPPLKILSVTSDGVSLTLNWQACVGRVYRVQYATDLGAQVWSDLPGDVTATGVMASHEDSIQPAGQRFYRVILVE